MGSSFGTKNGSGTGGGLLPHQERVNVEMFKAIENIGRKVERVEAERDRLARRLALIESSASVDERTGKLYLPVTVDPATVQGLNQRPAPKWPMAAVLANSAVALFTLGVVLFQQPPAPAQVLTARQLAALNALTTREFARLDDGNWNTISDIPEKTDTAMREDTPPADAGLRRASDAPRIAFEEGMTQPEDAEPRYTYAESYAPEPGAEQVEPEAEYADAKPETPGTPVTFTEATPEDYAPEQYAEAEPEAYAATEPAAGETTASIEQAAPPEDASAPVSLAPQKKPVKTAEAPAPKKAEAPPVVAAKKPAPAPKVAQAEPPVTAAAAEDPPRPLIANEDAITSDPTLPSRLADLEKRAFDGVAAAQHDLATLYASGKIVAQDYKRAVYWFSKAADGGIANADYNLGVMFQQGLGVKQDVHKALGWYDRAANHGHPEAMYNLGIAYIEGIGTKRDIDKGVAYFKKAANAGVAQAAYNLGVLYESNFVGAVDREKALNWYQVAVNQGHGDAEAAVARIKGQMAQKTYADAEPQAATYADVEPASGEGDASPADIVQPPTFAPTLVSRIQSELIRLGYLPQGTDTGALDSPTSDAIRAWQKQEGLLIDGQPSQDLLTRLGAR